MSFANISWGDLGKLLVALGAIVWASLWFYADTRYVKQEDGPFMKAEVIHDQIAEVTAASAKLEELVLEASDARAKILERVRVVEVRQVRNELKRQVDRLEDKREIVRDELFGYMQLSPEKQRIESIARQIELVTREIKDLDKKIEILYQRISTLPPMDDVLP